MAFFPMKNGAAVAQSAEHSAPDRGAKVQRSLGETVPFTLMASGAVISVVSTMSSKFLSKLYL